MQSPCVRDGKKTPQSKDAGFTERVVKPVAIAELLEMLRKLARGRHGHASFRYSKMFQSVPLFEVELIPSSQFNRLRSGHCFIVPAHSELFVCRREC
jgi:hypothetical protein